MIPPPRVDGETDEEIEGLHEFVVKCADYKDFLKSIQQSRL